MTEPTSYAPGPPLLGRIVRLTRKELRETLRDRRTVITLVLMPLLVYPLLSISFNKSMLVSAEQSTKIVYAIGVETKDDFDMLEGLLRRGSRLLDAQDATRTEEVPTVPDSGTPPIGPAELVEIHWFPASSLEQHVSDLDVHLAVRIRNQPTLAGERARFRPVECELIYRRNSAVSQQAMRFVEDRLQAVNESILLARLAALGRPARLPAAISRKPLAVGQSAPFSLATLVPLVLILMTITGAVYPAIDLTAGERERGTLETLIAAPISRAALLVAKYAAVLTVAVLTAMVNIVAMMVTVLSSGLGQQLFPDGLPITLVVEILGLLILFAAFFSAILLALTSFARSFKEAQAYLIPVMLLAISPGLLSLMPGLQLNGLLAVTPLVNIVLLSRDMLEGTASPGMAALAIVSTVVYAAAAIAVASKIFGNDALLYASRGSWSDLFQRPSTRRAAPTAVATVACLAVMFPCYFLLANISHVYAGDVASQLFLNAVVTIVVFAACPLLFAAAQRVRVRDGFQLRGAPVLAFVGALVLGLSVWPFAHELFLFGKWTGLATLDRDRFAEVERLLKAFQGLSPIVVLLTLSVVPAVAEEFFFRGFLFNGLQDRFRGFSVVVVSSLLFGLFHVLTPAMLTPERFLPSTFLGLILGWVRYRCGSVLPGMLLHACHNGLLLLIAQNKDALAARGWGLEGVEHLPLAWLGTAGCVTVVGGLIVFFATRTRPVMAATPRE